MAVLDKPMIKYPHRTFDVKTSGFHGISRLVNLNSLEEISPTCIVHYVQEQVYMELKTLGLLHMADTFRGLNLELSVSLEQVLSTPSETPIYIYEKSDSVLHIIE